MKIIKHILSISIISLFLWACSSLPINKTTPKEEPIVIANDSLKYEVTIIDIGFNLFLNSVAKPRNFYSQSYLETKNRFFVTNWNIRAQSPNQYNSNIYENVIDYQSNIDYGYEVNYLLFNYFFVCTAKI